MTNIAEHAGPAGRHAGKPDMTKDAQFWDRVADKYTASPIKNMAAYELTMDRTRSYLSPEMDVLEVGCGSGSTALLLAPGVKHMTATDVSGRMIEIGEAKARDQGASNVSFRQLGLPDDSLPAESFDAILCCNTLHLVTDLPATLGTLHGALKPGGMLISKTVCLAEQTRLWAVPIFLMRLVGKAPYVNMLTFNAVEDAISEAGFKIAETGTYPAPYSRFVVAQKT